MPEGPEVHNFADWINLHFSNALLVNLEFNDKSRFAKKDIPNLNLFLSYLPLTLTETWAVGKKIIFAFTHDIFLISSLMMEGRWSETAGKHSDLWLDFDDGRRLYYDDSRHFGLIEIVTSIEELNSRLSHVGPDLLTEEVSDKEWLAKIRNKRLARKKIGLWLMEQKHFSGIGNYLRAEILYAARISPHRSLGSLTEDEALSILDQAKKLMKRAYCAQGASLATYRHPCGDKGAFQVLIYKKEHDPKGYPVLAEDIGDKRTTYWVPALQE